MAQTNQNCVEACNACADACDRCAAACLKEPDVRQMARCIALDMDCAAICRLAAGFMSRGSQVSREICAACSDVCLICADECGSHPHDHCQRCADACRRCSDECLKMADG